MISLPLMRMKNFLLASYLIILTGGQTICAQGFNERATAKAYISQGDYNNAIMVLNRAIEKDNTNLELKKDLVFAYYLQRDYPKALQTARTFAERKEADVQSFQLLGMAYKATEEGKEAEKVYRAGLKKFPESGALYNDFGETLWARNEFTDAVRQWEKGIQMDPNYSGNYYNTCKYYYFSLDKVWGLLYGEIFLNLESFSKRTPEIKDILVEGYKKLFLDADLMKNQDNKNEFVRAFLGGMKQQSQEVDAGVTPDALSAVRTRFLLNWFEKDALRFPFRLFEYQRQLAKAGSFDAYNQWIFGASKNLSAFEQWTVTHAEEYEKFSAFKKSRVFKLPPGQYYKTVVK